MRKSRASTEAVAAREVTKPDEQWRQELTPMQYNVLRQAHTEMPFTGEYVRNHEDGFYRCAGCGAKLFSSDAKFNSGTGWPSFDQPAAQSATELIPALDESVRTAKQVLGGMEDSKLMGTWKLTKNGKELMAAPRGAMVVCWACSAVWRCKSSGQPDGGEGLVMMQGLPPRGGV